MNVQAGTLVHHSHSPEYEVYKDYYRVKLGAHVKDQPETWQQVCKIETLFLHPDYGKIVNVTKANHNNDMALLKLDCTVNFTDAVLPSRCWKHTCVYAHTVCLPPANETLFPLELMVVAGWGTTICASSVLSTLPIIHL
jgi:hypothetical protein